MGGQTYQDIMKDPGRIARRKAKEAELDLKVKHTQLHMAGREPEWDEERRLTFDKMALHHGRRCVLWDDEDSGFMLWMNWDWKRNAPAVRPKGRKNNPGWYENFKSMIMPPLLDTSVPDAKLCDWIDGHTMRIHRFLDKLDTVELVEGAEAWPDGGEETTPMYRLNHPYQKELDAQEYPF